ncbi:UNVERIFIED_CONTAM: Retrovirus-related Pol polyprotein from transposon RE2 [Sesamum angustifolium]|uniref:Retrovirus-related Pol polyprotein from transposon RE2 n=1 Tax=Sesamum angustifolium TaxID=2727405 RepID=A0AAW2NZ92_9LAMI
MGHKLDALEKNHTWDVTTLPNDKKAIGCKWVYKSKLRNDGSVERYKARLVAKDYNQIEGVDYVERFSPVGKTVTVRVFLAIASAYEWPLHRLDINNACLHGYLDEEIYMKPPEGYNANSTYDLGSARFFLGLQIAWSSLGTSITHVMYIHDIVSDTDLLADFFICVYATRYSHSAKQLSQFLQHPSDDHWSGALHVLKCLKGSSSQGFFFPVSNSLEPSAYCDADWASCVDSRKSLSGYYVF